MARIVVVPDDADAGRAKGRASRKVELVVHDGGGCPLLKRGDRWLVSGREIAAASGAKLCAWAVCSTYPKLRQILKRSSDPEALANVTLTCEICPASFRCEAAEPSEKDKTLILQGGGPSQSQSQSAARPSSTLLLKKLRKSAPFLFRLPKEVAGELVALSGNRRCEAGEVILKQGVGAEQLFVVAEGVVDLVRIGNDGEQTVGTLGPGTCFGEVSLLTGEHTSVEARSHGTSNLLTLSRQQVEDLMLRQPLVACEFSRLLADRVVDMSVSFQAAGHGISGTLSVLSVVDLVQSLHQSRLTGTLHITRGQERAEMGLRGGVICHALAGTVAGDEAFFHVIWWPSGKFRFESNTPPLDGPGQIQGNTTALLLEGLRRMDKMKERNKS